MPLPGWVAGRFPTETAAAPFHDGHGRGRGKDGTGWDVGYADDGNGAEFINRPWPTTLPSSSTATAGLPTDG